MTHVFSTITINASAEASNRLPLKDDAEHGLVFADDQVAGVLDAGNGEKVYATRSYTAHTGIIGGPSQTHAELYGVFLRG